MNKILNCAVMMRRRDMEGAEWTDLKATVSGLRETLNASLVPLCAQAQQHGDSRKVLEVVSLCLQAVAVLRDVEKELDEEAEASASPVASSGNSSSQRGREGAEWTDLKATVSGFREMLNASLVPLCAQAQQHGDSRKVLEVVSLCLQAVAVLRDVEKELDEEAGAHVSPVASSGNATSGSARDQAAAHEDTRDAVVSARGGGSRSNGHGSTSTISTTSSSSPPGHRSQTQTLAAHEHTKTSTGVQQHHVDNAATAPAQPVDREETQTAIGGKSSGDGHARSSKSSSSESSSSSSSSSSINNNSSSPGPRQPTPQSTEIATSSAIARVQDVDAEATATTVVNSSSASVDLDSKQTTPKEQKKKDKRPIDRDAMHIVPPAIQLFLGSDTNTASLRQIEDKVLQHAEEHNLSYTAESEKGNKIPSLRMDATLKIVFPHLVSENKPLMRVHLLRQIQKAVRLGGDTRAARDRQVSGIKRQRDSRGGLDGAAGDDDHDGDASSSLLHGIGTSAHSGGGRGDGRGEGTAATAAAAAAAAAAAGAGVFGETSGTSHTAASAESVLPSSGCEATGATGLQAKKQKRRAVDRTGR